MSVLGAGPEGAGAGAGPLVDVARVLAERDLVLADPEFRTRPGWFESWVLPVLQEIVEWFAGLSPLAHALVLVALGGAAAALLAHVFLSIAGQAGGRERRARPGPAAAGRARRSAADLAAAARAALAAGRFAEAVRLSWLLALRVLDAAGVSPDLDGRADWEHVADVRRLRPDAAGEVATLAGAFQRARFGGAAPEADAAARCLDLALALERRVSGGDAAVGGARG